MRVSCEIEMPAEVTVDAIVRDYATGPPAEIVAAFSERLEQDGLVVWGPVEATVLVRKRVTTLWLETPVVVVVLSAEVAAEVSAP